MSETIFVTGATGNIGGNVVRELLARNQKIKVDMRSKDKGEIFTKQGIATAVMDFNDPQSIEAGLAGIEKVFSMTPLVPGFIPMALNFVKAAKKAGVKHIVRLSGMGADALQPITVGKWHREIEKAIEDAGIDHTFLRPNSFMQNYINFAGHTIKTQSAFYFPQGDGKMSYVDARDVGAVAAVALTKDGHRNKAYTITGPDAVSNYDIAKILSTVTGRTINYVDVTEDAARNGMREAGVPDIMIEMLMELYAINKAGYTATVTDAVEKITGKKAISFRQFAADFAQAFKSRV
jgi:uncharacterized protein YbjT (DUF2867 family)